MKIEKPLNLLLFHHGNFYGGTDTFAFELAKNLANSSNFFIVLNKSHPFKELYFKESLKSGFTTFEYKSKSIHDVLEGLDIRFKLLKVVFVLILYPFNLLKLFRELYSFVKKNKIDGALISIEGYPASDLPIVALIFLHFFSVRKNILLIHSDPSKSTNFFSKFLDRLVSSRVRYIVSVSKDSSIKIDERRMFSKPSVVIYNGISLTDRQKKLASDSWNRSQLKPNSKVIGMIANFELSKGHGYCVEAFKNVLTFFPDSYLVFIGEPHKTYFKDVLNQIKNLKIESKVIFLGSVHHAEDLIDQFDILANCSVEKESFGLVILEAWKRKVPVVAFKTGGIKEVVDSEVNGILVNPREVNALSNAFIKVLKDPEYAKKLAENGFNKLSKSFTSKRMAEEYLKLFN